jgi:hypothetical protein
MVHIGNSPHTTPIHILDDDSLLRVFYLYRPFLLGEDEDENARLYGGTWDWVRGRWWYRLAHVCQRWRNLILGSPSYLGIFLVCTYRTPVADMLAHSPPLPLIIDYRIPFKDLDTKDEEGAILALKQRDRVHRVRLHLPVTSLQKLISVMDEEYPNLEYLIIAPPDKDRSSILILPETLQAPHLRHLTLVGFALPIGSRLLTAAVGLVTLSLIVNNPSTYFHPNSLLRWLSFMPQLETLLIGSFFAVPNREIERQLSLKPTITTAALPNLHQIKYRGVSAYLEALVQQITASRLEKLHVVYFNQLTFSIPRLVQFMNTTENLRFDSGRFRFDDDKVYVHIYPRDRAEMNTLFINVDCWYLDWQVSSVAQIFNSLSQLSSAVEHLTFEHEVHSRSSEEHNEVDRTEWHKLLRPFRNVKTLYFGNGIVEQLSRCLELEDGELPLELLPELQELTYSRSGDTGDAFTSFINARQNAGRPVTVVTVVTDPDDPALVSHAQGSPAVTSGSNDSETGSDSSDRG